MTTNDYLVAAFTMLGRGDGLALANWLLNDAPMPAGPVAQAIARVRASGNVADIELMRSFYAAARPCLDANAPMSKINFGTMAIGNFRAGGHKSACWYCKPGERVIHVHDGDVTTYAYAVDAVFTDAEFDNWVDSIFEEGYSINHLEAVEFEIEQPEASDEAE